MNDDETTAQTFASLLLFIFSLFPTTETATAAFWVLAFTIQYVVSIVWNPSQFQSSLRVLSFLLYFLFEISGSVIVVMVSLTPPSRAEEVTGQAMTEGLTNSAMVLFPSMGALFFAMQNPKFVKFTNWQSRTAMTIMPAFFIFTLTSEQKMTHRMNEVAEETEHSIRSVEWADREHRRRQNQTVTEVQKEAELRTLYRQAILESSVRIVPGDTLASYQQVANYIQSNPFKVLGTIGGPAIAYIFWGRQGKTHLNMQMKLLHTRVYGQFTIICTMLSVMAVKEIMDRSGRYISELEVEQRVEDMVQRRQSMLDHLEYRVKEDQKEQEELRRSRPKKSTSTN